MTTKPDICGNIPVYGDYAAFNPPYYKGLVYGEIVGFVESTGNPIIRVMKEQFQYIPWGYRNNEQEYIDYNPKTGYVIIKPPSF